MDRSPEIQSGASHTQLVCMFTMAVKWEISDGSGEDEKAFQSLSLVSNPIWGSLSDGASQKVALVLPIALFTTAEAFLLLLTLVRSSSYIFPHKAHKFCIPKMGSWGPKLVVIFGALNGLAGGFIGLVSLFFGYAARQAEDKQQRIHLFSSLTG